MSSSLQVTVQNAVQASSDLKTIFGICLGSGVSPTSSNWVECLQLVYTNYQQLYSTTPAIDNFTAGIYTSWAVGQPTTAGASTRLSSTMMINSLAAIQNGSSPAFTYAEIQSVIPKFYAIINITIDTESILSAYNNDSGKLIFLDTFISMNDNESASVDEGTNELKTNGLFACQTIEWTAANASGTAAIDLIGFVAGNPAQLFALVYPPVQINYTQFYTQVLPNPLLSMDSYYFQFKINGGSTAYYWDPFLS